MVQASAQSPEALLEYVRERDLSRPIKVMVGQADIKGVYFYRDDMSALNFEFASRTFHNTLGTLLANRKQGNPSAIYTGRDFGWKRISRRSARKTRSPSWTNIGWTNHRRRPTCWLGNAITMATHYDNLDGINCIVAGRKRFTFFPPDQFPNLYIGPLELAPAGQPISLVKVSAPDLERYPRFAQALRRSRRRWMLSQGMRSLFRSGGGTTWSRSSR